MKNDKLAEIKIDKEITRRTCNGYIHVYHITSVSPEVNGITIVSLSRLDYLQLLVDVTDEAYRLDEDTGAASARDMRAFFADIQARHTMITEVIGVAICDYRDQYSYQEGRTRAKRDWLRAQAKL